MKEKTIEYANKIFLGKGYVSTTYTILVGDQEYVLCEGNNKNSLTNYEQLKDKLDFINKKNFSVPIPKNIKIINSCKEHPFGALLYPKLQGKDMGLKSFRDGIYTEFEKKKMAKVCAEFLNELHAILLNDARDYFKNSSCESLFNKENSSIFWLNDIQKGIETIEELKLLTYSEIEKLSKISNNFKEFLQNSTFCIIHGDFHPGNILVNNTNEISAIIDFGNLKAGVPEMDFAFIYRWTSEDFIKEMLKSYTFKNININDIKLAWIGYEITVFNFLKENNPTKLEGHADKMKKMLAGKEVVFAPNKEKNNL